MIRRANKSDLSRIAEILVFVKRMKYRSIFHNDAYSFGELQVIPVAEQYSNPEILENIWVYEEDEIVKGLIHIENNEVMELYVDYFFMGQGIGAELIEFAKKEYEVRFLWTLEKNHDAIKFYETHGFGRTGDRQLEEGTPEYIVKMERLMKALVINCSPVRNGATAEIVSIVSQELSKKYDVKSICIDDYTFSFCKGCRSCHSTAKCVIEDDIQVIMDEFDAADVIVSVSPSYWADIPGQYKAFIDRCTPWCNTHEPHATIRPGKRGYAIALRTGPSMPECERIIKSIEHFYGHLEIQAVNSLGLCSVEYKENVEHRKREIIAFCEDI